MIYEGGNKMKSFHEMSSDMISKIYKFESLKPVVDGSKHIIGDIDILHPDTNSYFFVPAYACDDFVELPFYTIIDECRGDDELFLMRVQKMRINKDMEFQPFTVGVINLSRTAVIEGDKVDISLSMTEDNVLKTMQLLDLYRISYEDLVDDIREYRKTHPASSKYDPSRQSKL